MQSNTTISPRQHLGLGHAQCAVTLWRDGRGENTHYYYDAESVSVGVCTGRICRGETGRKGRVVIGEERFLQAELRPCGSSVCKVLIQNASRSGRVSGSQCSSGTILWSLRKSCDCLVNGRYIKGPAPLFRKHADARGSTP